MDSKYEWDSSKATENWLKHGVGFPDAAGVFEDPLAITVPDDYPNEVRSAAVSSVDSSRGVHVARRDNPNHICPAGDTRRAPSL
jgi:uncharacterized DUF497 family protein